MFTNRRHDLCGAGKSTTSYDGVSAADPIRLSVRYLLDVNILVAWGWSDHVDHDRTVTWIASTRKSKSARLLTSAIPQLGFVRVSVQRTSGLVTVKEASATLGGMLKSLGARHLFVADNLPAADFPAWCHHASRTTDAHLVELAQLHDAKLATLDAGIPNAFLVPALPPTEHTSAR